MNKKDYLNFHDFASTLEHNKKNITSPHGLCPVVSDNSAEIPKSKQSYLMPTLIFMMVQSIVPVIFSIAVLQNQKKTFTIQTGPSIQEVR